MSNSLKKRIIGALMIGGFLFMLCCVDGKLLNYREDWLFYSFMWSLSWSIGYFVSKTIGERTADDSLIETILFEAVILFFVAVVMAFITGILINLPNWDYIVSNTCPSFALSLLINNKWRKH